MKGRNLFGLVLSVMLLLLTAGSSLARGPQPAEPPGPAGVNASPGANAPWFNIEVDIPPNTGQYTSVAISPSDGGTYISYYDATNKRLRMARNRGYGTKNCGPDNKWICTTVHSGADFGKYSSIAISPANGEIGIAYHDATSGSLKYAHGKICPTCAWERITIDKGVFPLSSTGLFTSLKFDSDGTPHIAYYFRNTVNVDALMVASYVGSGGNCGHATAAGRWQCDTIKTGEGVGQYASLALDGAGNKHIAYYDRGNGDLWYATSRIGTNCGPGGNSWLCYPVTGGNADVGRYASLYVGRGNHFHIAYYDATADMLKYAVDVGSGGNCGVFGSAQCIPIDDMQTGYHPLGVSIAQDRAGAPIIAYQSEFGSLNVARPLSALGLVAGSGNCGPENPYATWYCQTVKKYNPIAPARHGDFASIAVHSSGLATIAYHEFITSAGGNLGVAYQQFQVHLPVVLRNQ